MAGGLVQIAYTGNQDKFLTQLPQVTWFKSIIHRYVQFAVEDFLLQPEHKLSMSMVKDQYNSTEFVLRQFADLVFRPVLKITLPDIEATYEHEIQYYVTEFLNKTKINNVQINVILSSIRAILQNYDSGNNGIKSIYINDNLTVTYDYENMNFGQYVNNRTNFETFQSENPITSFDFMAKHRSIIMNKNEHFNKNIYYTPYNINYLVTELSKLSFSNDIILTSDDYYEMFRDTLYNYITGDNENKYIYSIINNRTPYTTGYEMKNVITTVTDELTYNLEYKYSNMRLLFIYSKNKLLKSIFYVKSFLYSTNTYINKVKPVKNLYSAFELVYTNNSKPIFISDGFNTNKQMNIFLINNIVKIGSSYDISSNITVTDNTLYFIYFDKLSSYQGQSFTSSLPGIEDYYDMFFNEPNISSSESMLIPVCVLTYNTGTGLFDQIIFDYNVINDDYIYDYKDVLIYDQTISQVSHVLINNNLYTVHNELSVDALTIDYSDNIKIYNPIKIVDGIVKSNINQKILFLVSFDDDGLILINNNGEKYIGKDFISPFRIKIDINNLNNDINRLIPVESVSSMLLNLDCYENTKFILNSLEEYNKQPSEKISLLYSNIINTKINNIQHIKNIYETIFNYLIYYKFYNAFTFKKSNSVVQIPLNTNFTTNVLQYLLPLSRNGVNGYYCALQEIIVNLFTSFTETSEIAFVNYIRSITNLNNQLSYINVLVNVSQTPYSLYIPLLNDTIYYHHDLSRNLLLSKIVFQVNPLFLGLLEDMSAIGLTLYTIDGYYYVNDMFYESIITDSGSTMLLTPLQSNINDIYYIFNKLLNTTDISGQYPFTTFYVMPNNLDISSVTLSTYGFTINRSDGLLNIFNTYDSLTNNNTVHFRQILNAYTNNVKSKSIDVKYILYHYADMLYADIRDRTITLSQNIFTLYNDTLMHKQLWFIRQSINKCASNGNTNNLINLNENSTSSYFLDCNLSITEYIDHVIINNSLRLFLEYYINDIITPKVRDLLNNNKGWFNFYNKSTNVKFYNINTDISSLDVNLLLQDGMSTIKWYLFYLNSVISDVKNYIVNDNAIYILSNPKLETVINLLEFFDTSENIFAPTYLGSNVLFNESYYEQVTIINKLLSDMIEHVKVTIKDRYIKTDKGISIYSDNIDETIIEKLDFKNISITYLFDTLYSYYGSNFQDTYEYSTLLPFFNTFKQQYMSLYKSFIDACRSHGSFTYDICDKLSQNLSFDLNDYIKQVDWLCYNYDYDYTTDLLLSRSGVNSFNSTFIGNNNSQYNFKIMGIDDINSSTSFLKMFYTVSTNLINNANNMLLQGKNLLSIKYKPLNELVKMFNKFFTLNYSFYSDYQLIYVLYFYFYKSFTFTMDSIEYTLNFDNTDNTSSNNYIETIVETYPFSWIVFVDNNNVINYTVSNKKLYDVNISQNINYIVTYDMLIDNIIKQYDNEYTYIIFGENIVDINGIFMYKIQASDIYDASNNNVGSITIDKYGEKVYTILDHYYKYEIIGNKQLVLFGNYQNVLINNEQLIINGISFTIIYNVFYDTTHNIKFKFILPFIDEPYTDNVNTNVYMSVIGGTFSDSEGSIFSDGVYGTKISSLIPNELYDKSNINIDYVFKHSFNTTILQQNIKYLQNSVLKSIFNIDIYGIFTIKTNMVNKLLHSICVNSVFPLYNYIDDTIKTINYNNWIKYNDMSLVLQDIEQYNKTAINKIVMFNEDLQTFTKPYNSTDNVHFTCEQVMYVKDKSQYGNFTTSTENKLYQCSYIKQNNLLSECLSMQIISDQIKTHILDHILYDISLQQLSDIYNPNVHFDVSDSVLWSLGPINDYSYFIRNAIVINRDQYLALETLSYDLYNLIYENNKYYIVHNIKYLITFTEELKNYDISYNNHYLKFIDDQEQVLIHVNPSFPKMITIQEGILKRMDDIGHEFIINDQGRLHYNYEYDLSSHIFLSICKSYNDIIFNDVTILDISCTLINGTDIHDIIDIHDNTIINDPINIFAIMDTCINILNEYVIIDRQFAYVTWQKDNIVKLFVQEPEVILFENVTLSRNIHVAIQLLGYEKCYNKTVFWYYESILSSLNEIKQFIYKNNDTMYIDQKFTCANYIDNIYTNMNTMLNGNLFDTVESYNTKSIFNITSFTKDNILLLSKNLTNMITDYKQDIEDVKYMIKRPKEPKCSWIDYIGNFICDKVEFTMSTESVEKINDHIIHISNMQNITENNKKAMLQMLGHNTWLQVPQQYVPGKILYVPLPLCFNDCTKALPLLALINTKLSVKVTVKDLQSITKAMKGVTVKVKSKFKMELNTSYVFLEKDAAEKFARSRHEYLIEIKHCYKNSITDSKGQIPIDAYQPCKEMAWFYLDQDIKNDNDYWNYTGNKVKIYNPELLDCNIFDFDDSVKQYAQKLMRKDLSGINVNMLNSTDYNRLKHYITVEMNKPSINPFLNTIFSFNGQIRFDMEGDRSNIIEPMLFTDKPVVNGLNMKTFSRISPLEHMGYLNMSGAYNMTLDYELLKQKVDGELNVILTTYQILRIASGFGMCLWK